MPRSGAAGRASRAGRNAPARSAVDDRVHARTVESWADGDWEVGRVVGANATKPYHCPGCDQDVRVGTPHVVAWPVDRVGDRRHWHTACWRSRDRRRPTRRRGAV